MNPIIFQRYESAAIAAAAAVAFIYLGFTWVWLAVLFLVFDLSMLGYLINPRLGALLYNSVHAFVIPVPLLLFGLLQQNNPLIFVALLWIFHIGIDRAVGYGLKTKESFYHTHLGSFGPRKK